MQNPLKLTVSFSRPAKKQTIVRIIPAAEAHEIRHPGMTIKTFGMKPNSSHEQRTLTLYSHVLSLALNKLYSLFFFFFPVAFPGHHF